MASFPWMQFFPGDWVADTRLLTLSAKGAWIDILAALHNSPTRGELTLDVEAWARLIGATPHETGVVIRELERTAVADIATLPDAKVTIRSRRMAREEGKRRSHAKRQERYRLKNQHSVTKASRGDAALSTNDAECDAPNTLFDLSLPESDTLETQKCRGRGQKLEAQIILTADAEKEGKKKGRPRNPLLDALASLTCSNLAEVTDWGRHAKALQTIQAVTPDVTPDEIGRRAAKYQRAHPDWVLTSTALASHWGEFANGSNGAGPKPADIYTEPADWRRRWQRKYPQIPVPAEWAGVSVTMRNELIR